MVEPMTRHYSRSLQLLDCHSAVSGVTSLVKRETGKPVNRFTTKPVNWFTAVTGFENV